MNDRSAAVPGFTVDISLGGASGEDVVLDWSGNGFDGAVDIYRSADPEARLDIALGEPLPAGTDALTGIDWVVCAADADQAWVSHADPGGGQLHAEQICNQLGYASLGSFGGTCGNQCGYCEGATSCEAPGSQTYDGGGACGADENGPCAARGRGETLRGPWLPEPPPRFVFEAHIR